MQDSTIPDTDAAKIVRSVWVHARQQWHLNSQWCDLAEYEDAAMAALAGCLARYDPTRGVTFHVYARYHVKGAVQDAQQLHPAQDAAHDPLLRTWFLRQVATRPPKHATLLQQLLQGTDLPEILPRWKRSPISSYLCATAPFYEP
jgi:hypothetical protein